MRTRIDALAYPADEGWNLASPKLGRFTAAFAAGRLVEAGDVLGTLRVLNRRFDVVVPAGVAGRVVEIPVAPVDAPLCYDEVLARVASAEIGGATLAAAADSGLDLEPGQWVVRAQMDGQFYRRPSPEEPEYVAVGDTLAPGTKIGLVEVMKFFYPVAYEGDAPARVVRVVAPDSAPLAAGDPLLVLEPA